jgi:hypothetical protein
LQRQQGCDGTLHVGGTLPEHAVLISAPKGSVSIGFIAHTAPHRYDRQNTDAVPRFRCGEKDFNIGVFFSLKDQALADEPWRSEDFRAP